MAYPLAALLILRSLFINVRFESAESLLQFFVISFSKLDGLKHIRQSHL